jgi:hypothetical protein
MLTHPLPLEPRATSGWHGSSPPLGSAAGWVVAVLALLPLTDGDAPALITGTAVCLISAAYAATSTIANTVNMSLCRASSQPVTAGAGGVR